MKSFSALKFRIACILPFFLRNFIKKCLKKRRQKKNSSIAAQLADIRNILTFNMPIDRVPQATGKLRLLQQGNTVLLDLFSRRCKEHGLRYWMDYGTLLGAVRHKGFIPWDDDLDVSMLRSDFEQLVAKLPDLFPKKDGFTWRLHAFLQIGFEGTPLNIDVYPFHLYNAPITATNRAEVEAKMTSFKKSVILQVPYINFTDSEIQKKIAADMLNGKPALPEEAQPGIFLSPAITFTKNTALAYDTIFPLRKLNFEGIELFAPNQARQYLQFFYGDYMSYPPTVGFQHPSVERMVKHMPFENAVNRFIDTFS